MNYTPKLIYCQILVKSLDICQCAILNPLAILKLLTSENEYYSLQKLFTLVLYFQPSNERKHRHQTSNPQALRSVGLVRCQVGTLPHL